MDIHFETAGKRGSRCRSNPDSEGEMYAGTDCSLNGAGFAFCRLGKCEPAPISSELYFLGVLGAPVERV